MPDAANLAAKTHWNRPYRRRIGSGPTRSLRGRTSGTRLREGASAASGKTVNAARSVSAWREDVHAGYWRHHFLETTRSMRL